MKTFVDVNLDSDFTIFNIPFGVFEKGNQPRACSRIGDYIIDLVECESNGMFSELNLPKGIFNYRFLNEFIGFGKATTNAVRKIIQEALKTGGYLQNIKSEVLIEASNVKMLLPIQIGDYTDFYSSREHATNVGIMFRDPANALLPNWLHMPVGYHGRASSIVVSGTPIQRPNGQMIPLDADQPIFGACKQVDFELEMGFVVGKETNLGDSISTDEAEDYIFGLMLFNDWSARDIQKWEYVPLGPFLGKNFGSTISPWIISLEALEAFRTPGPTQEPEVLPYLKYTGNKNYDIKLEVDIITEKGDKTTVSKSNFQYMYWNMCQQLAHHTVNGCNVKIGDLMASGTISGKDPGSYGSMLEIAWKGTKPVQMKDGTERKFIQDGDIVSMKAWCEKDGVRIGFGECQGKIIPNKKG